MQLETQNSELKRDISLYGLIMIAAGSSIGSGIFLTPQEIASTLPFPRLIIIAWIIGGIVALTGALTFAELGAKFPKTGGVYVFLREAYGNTVAFMYGWVVLTVMTTGSLAALGLGFAQYFCKLVGLSPDWYVLVGVFTISFLTIINAFGVKISEIVAASLTTTKLIGIAIIIILGLFFISVEVPVIELWQPKNTENHNLIKGFAIALIGVLWSYGGWHHASYLAGETKNPQKTVPKAMIIGASIVAITYILSNIAYHNLLSVEEIQNSSTVAADAVSKIHASGGFFISLLIAISIFGTTSIFTMSAPRIYFAMAKDGIFFKSLAKVNPYYKTPINAIVTQSIIAMILLLFWQTFSNLITYVVFMDWVFMTLGAISIFIFRKKMKESLGYKTWGYPIIPIIFITISVAFIITTSIFKPLQTLGGVVVLASGFLVFYILKQRNQ